ncbi:hypothetical protein [Helicobacter brantae]|uniref:N-acetyltransferase domain-containing protein n=1 Tax=Helicobacter brantae TaxID=375927 RepID=A0A3D8IX17_9HELI|nr:hypothetical protein [Helicobacter brantae]RDU69154.1 hypothetical protein CQA58_07460 [Helicobacter brantae]
MQTYSLGELLHFHQKEKIEKKIKDFRCKDKSINHFFTKKAIIFEEKHICRTYINWEADSIDSFFSIAMGIIAKESIKKETAKLIFDSINTKQKTHIPVFLLAQLAKRMESKSIGNTLVNQAMGLIYEIQSRIGGALIVVDAINQEKIIKLYREFDFQEIEESKDKKIVKMMHYISTAL